MSLLDKFKNLFTDEEEEEIEEEIPIKNDSKKDAGVLPTFMREKIEREEKSNIENTSDLVKQIPTSDLKANPNDEDTSDTKLEENANDGGNNFKFPIAFEEKDFVETTRKSRQNVIYQEQEKKKEKEELKKKKASEVYGSKKEKKETPKFKASPIISPVYGVLDKNYKKEEVKVNNGTEVLSNYESKSSTKTVSKVDFESVRKKAFGSLTDEIRDNLNCESCELYKEAVRAQQENEQEFFGKNDSNDNNKDISVGEAFENYYDFGVSYEPVHKYDETDEVKIVNHTDNTIESEKIDIKEPVNSKPNVLSTLRKSMGDVEEEKKEEEVPVRDKKSIEDLELTDDLFNLIDSMYEERNDD